MFSTQRKGRCHVRAGFILSLATLVLAVFAPQAVVAETTQYQEIQIDWPTENQMRIIQSFPDLEPMKIEKDSYMHLLSTPELTQQLIDAGLQPTVIVDDLEAFYSERLRGERNFGDFYTYSEMVTAIDALHAAYPDITTDKISLVTSWECNYI